MEKTIIINADMVFVYALSGRLPVQGAKEKHTLQLKIIIGFERCVIAI